MSPDILILRPEPGASATAARAEAMGLRAVAAPLFTVAPLTWEVPDPAACEAVLLTSANAARYGGEGLQRLFALPCYAVGEATGEAALEAGFADVRVGPSDAGAAAAAMEADGIKRALHLAGRDHVVPDAQVGLERRLVYAADAVSSLPSAAAEGLAAGALALLHSARAASLFAQLVGDRSRVRIAAISEAALEAAGEGWRSGAAAAEPRDSSLLELAAKLCNKRPTEREDGRR